MQKQINKAIKSSFAFLLVIVLLLPFCFSASAVPSFPDTSGAKTVYLWNEEYDKVIHSSGKDEVVHPASFTKIMTGLVAIDLIGERLDEELTDNVEQADCLIIDCYGLLSSIYRYGEISYIGGGFGVGIHNVLEAAVYGIPVIFGPNNKKFREAQHLLANKGGFEIQGSEDFEQLMNKFLNDEAYLKQSGKAAGDYVKGNAGAMELIMNHVFAK